MASSVSRDFALKGTLAKHSMIEGREVSSFGTGEKQNIFHKQFYPEELFFFLNNLERKNLAYSSSS